MSKMDKETKPPPKNTELLDQEPNTSFSDDSEIQMEKKIPYPKSVFFIVSNEFCERFSYYGMRTILSLYLVQMLGYIESDAKVLYHMFTMFVYFFPVFGAIIADSWLGKFRTIFYVSCIYAVGNVVLAMAATGPLHFPQREISILGLMLIAVGTGGIKPCVSAFGGDQFTLPQQEIQLAKFFSMFYFSINAGSLISTLLTPVLRENVHCFGEESCYPLAFGVPGILMVISIVIFVLGKPLYKIKKPSGNVVVLVSKCISHALVKKIKSKGEKKEHWLDYASDEYDSELISDIKATLKVLFLYLPIPVFWALFDQQGTGWTFQASRMSGNIGFYTILPDQMQVVNPLLILAFIPLFDTCIYPLLNKCRLLRTPLQRLTVGGLLAAVAFCISAVIEFQLEHTYPVFPQAGEAQLRIYNSLPCNLDITGLDSPIHMEPMGYYNSTIKIKDDSNDFNLLFKQTNCSDVSNQKDFSFTLSEKDMLALFVKFDSKNTFDISNITDNVDKSNNGYPLVRTMVGVRNGSLMDVTYSASEKLKLNTTAESALLKTVPDTYKLYVGGVLMGKVELKLGGVYSVLVDFDNMILKQFTISQPNDVHILWLIPQYVVITLAEIMFSVTGLEFSYSQAPVSMKSVLQAGWLLTTAFGNLLVIIVEEARAFESQAYQYFLYAGLMVVDMVVFALMAMRYKYVKKPEDEDDDDSLSMATADVKHGKENLSYEHDAF